MNKNWKKVLGLALAVSMTMGLLAGCGKNNSKESNNAATTAPTAGAAQDSGATAASNVDENGFVIKGDGKSWTWDTSPVELSVFVVEGWYTNDWDTEKYAYFKKVADETGLSFKFTSGDESKLNALIASGNLPDIISMWTGYSQRRMLEEGDKLYALDDLISKYAPTFDTLPASMMNWYKNPTTGKTYATANYFYAEEYLTPGQQDSTVNRITARADLLKKLNLTADNFKTKADFKASLQKFKDANITYNGLPVSPFMLGAANPAQSVGMFAAYFGTCQEDGTTGDYVDDRTTPEMKEAMLYLNDLYRSGLLDVECLTIDNEQLRQKVGSGATFITTGQAGSTAPATSALMSTDPNAYMVPVGPLQGDNGKPFVSGAGGQGWQAVVITKNCKRPDRAIRFIEYLYDEKNMLQANFGMEGLVWTMGDDGKIKYTDQYLADKAADPANVNTKYGFGGNALMFTAQSLLMNKYLPPYTDPIDIKNKEIEDFYKQFTFFALPLSELESTLDTDTAAISAKLSDIWNQAIASVITAGSEEEASAAYDTAIANMKSEGWDKYMQAMTTEFKARKAKLGMEFIHPYNKK